MFGPGVNLGVHWQKELQTQDGNHIPLSGSLYDCQDSPYNFSYLEFQIGFIGSIEIIESFYIHFYKSSIKKVIFSVYTIVMYRWPVKYKVQDSVYKVNWPEVNITAAKQLSC